MAPVGGFAAALLLSAFLLLLAVGFVVGGWLIAGEIRDSSYVYSINTTLCTSSGELCTEGTLSYCARIGDFVPVAAVFGSAAWPSPDLVAPLPLNQSCPPHTRPWEVSCVLSDYAATAGNTSFGNFPTLLTLLRQPSVEAFRQYSRTHGPASYVESHPDYGACENSPASVLIAIFAVMQGAQGLGLFLGALSAISAASAGATKLGRVLQRKSKLNPFAAEGQTLERVSGHIELKDVVFAYPSAPERLAADRLCLTVNAGETVALCGPSGCGKSTTFALLERFYDPQSGVVMLDGVDLKALNVRWLRSQLGLVSQEPVLFQGTVSENVLYGKPGASEAEVEAACRMSNAHNFISNDLADGYATQVGQGGGKLSGGQKQRVAIARALIRAPAVLLLDEATSALDTESEKIVQAALDEIMQTHEQKRTTLVIAHRLSTIRNADAIAVIRQGRVAEKGTYDELFAIGEGGHFHKMAEKEAVHAEVDQLSMARAAEGASTGSAPGTPLLPAQAGVGVSPEIDVVFVGGAEKKAAGKPKERTPLKRVFAIQSGSWWLIGVGIIFSVGSGGVPVFSWRFVTSYFIALFNASHEQLLHDVWYWLGVVGIMCGTMLICVTLDSLCFGVAAARLTAKLRQAAMDALMRQDMSFFEEEGNSAGALVAFLSEKVATIEGLTGTSIQLILRVASGVVVMLVLDFVVGPYQLALVLFLAFPVMATVMSLMTKFLMPAEYAKKQGKEDTTARGLADNEAGRLIGQAVVSIRTVSSFGLEEHFYALYAASINRVLELENSQVWKQALMMGLSLTLMMFVFASIYYYLGYLLSVGATTFEAGMIPIFVLFGTLSSILGAISAGMTDVPTASAAARRLFQLVDRTSALDPTLEAGQTLERVSGHIELKDVVFAYPSAPERLAADRLCLTVNAGETVALCGPSGCGKSTTFALLERFYDPQSGVVMLDGVDLKALNVRWLRSQLGLVSQEPVLFQGTVSENVLYGKPGASEAEVEAACRMSNAHNFISNDLADGYATQVGQGGGKLSGGQKQRVAIARALIRAPAVLLLDEATSALDTESEKIVQAALDEIMQTHEQKRTTLVIAHRLSTIRNADAIAVIRQGRVAEKGTHNQLVARNDGLYQKLVKATT